MLRQLGRLGCLVALIAVPGYALAQNDESVEESFERDHSRKFYICTANATDDSGLFFLGMSHNMAEAYIKAMDTCIRQKRTCTVTCETQF